MIPQEIIRAKRDGQVLSESDITGFIGGLVNGAVTEGQVAAFAMAVYFQGMNITERVALTKAMRDSGTVLNWDLPGPVLDKHSTGGVGDTVSLMLAPMVAACGGYVPMISGRGLGHTGGTYDKMESIPGYTAAPTMPKFRSVVGKIGCAIIGQTPDLAPADKRLYGIRDVTATVESIGLITASILSKKLAAGLQGLAMDVKVGNGAFMPTLPAARELARSIVEVATGAGLPTTALITDMNRPLADAAGNALEVAYAIDYLTGARRDPRMHEITLALCTEMLLHGKLARTPKSARAKLQAALDSGAPYGAAVADMAGQDLPAILTDNAQSGLPTLQTLRTSFPDAARVALDTALQANMGESWAERVGAFLRGQTGARSLTPREGTDPDAVLSRAEAALAAGDLPTALTELDALPPQAQAALTDWRAKADLRLQAATAVQGLLAAAEH